MCKDLCLFVCGVVCVCSPVCTLTYMCFTLNGPLRFSHGYLLVISQQQNVKASNTPHQPRHSGVYLISVFACCVKLPKRRKRLVMWAKCGHWRIWDVELGGASGLHLSIFFSLTETESLLEAIHFFFWLMVPKMTSDVCDKSAIRQGQQLEGWNVWNQSGINHFFISWSFLAQ